jgi:hypothetical protein
MADQFRQNPHRQLPKRLPCRDVRGVVGGVAIGTAELDRDPPIRAGGQDPRPLPVPDPHQPSRGHEQQDQGAQAHGLRKGNVVCKVMERAGDEPLSRFVRDTVSENVSLVATDDFPAYRRLPAGLPARSGPACEG